MFSFSNKTKFLINNVFIKTLSNSSRSIFYLSISSRLQRGLVTSLQKNLKKTSKRSRASLVADAVATPSVAFHPIYEAASIHGLRWVVPRNFQRTSAVIKGVIQWLRSCKASGSESNTTSQREQHCQEARAVISVSFTVPLS